MTASPAASRDLDHPVIDSDGHFVEFYPAFLDYLRDVVGNDSMAGFEAAWSRARGQASEWYDSTLEQRQAQRIIRPGFWNIPTRNTLDLATATFPALLEERMAEIGSDFTVLYPGLGLVTPGLPNAEVRQATCRALNNLYADLFAPHGHAMTPVALIPMHTVDEAIAELDYAVGELGLKAVMMPSYVLRPVPSTAERSGAVWIDTYGIDSAHDYDPVWQRCLDLGVAPTFHSGSTGIGTRNSISNYCYNHIGHFAGAAEALCKSLVFGGVPMRFPQLRFSFLEAGVGWARSLMADLISHWSKRNRDAISNYDPANLDREHYRSLFERYGGPVLSRYRVEHGDEGILAAIRTTERDEDLDEFAASGITSADDIRDMFQRNFFFGCEADDIITASAYDTARNPMRARFNAFYGSDIGHWDVVDMSKVFDEATELVDDGIITTGDFRDFVFGTPVRLWCGANPSFFAGTGIEAQVRTELDEAATR